MTCYKNVLDSGPKSDIVRRSNYSAIPSRNAGHSSRSLHAIGRESPDEQAEMRKIDLTNFHVATSETARDINRRIVLNLIRTHQPVSRADLARSSGLQPSTVSVITEQLIDQRWVK